jgi:hypothetical protein
MSTTSESGVTAVEPFVLMQATVAAQANRGAAIFACDERLSADVG